MCFDNQLYGGARDNFLAGGPGFDTLTGGAGRDAVYFYDSDDVTPVAPDDITDFANEASG